MTIEEHQKNVRDIKDIFERIAECGLGKDTYGPLFKIYNSYLWEFGMELKEQGVSMKTINRHVGNAEYYVKRYLVEYMEIPIFDGAKGLHEFFDYYYIRKCLSSSVKNMKQQILSTQKFYLFLFEHGYLTKERHEECERIFHDKKEQWLQDMADYDDLTKPLEPWCEH